jgi:uncharacterized YceG family protein
MDERSDWFADSGGNLTPPGEEPPRRELKPPTDEFGRDDPAALEREQRRREREARRRGKGAPAGKRPKKRGAGRGAEKGGLLSGLRGRRERTPEESVSSQQAPDETAPPQRPPSRRDVLRERLASRSGGEGGEDGPPRGRAGFGRRRAIAIALGLIGILFVWFLVALFQPFAGDGQGSGTIEFTVKEGEGAGDIASNLADAGVISNAQLFEIRLRLAGKSSDIQAGPYVLAEGMSYGAAIDRLTGEVGEEELVLIEGESRVEYADDVATAGFEGDYLAATKSSKSIDLKKYGAQGAPNLEGFLFPATYPVRPNETVEELVSEQLLAFEQNFNKVDLSYAKKKNLTPYDVLIIASMVQREVQVKKEMPLVAAVIYNRLSRGEPLGIDATTRYEYNNWTDEITQDQLDKDTPFNTRLNAGLTPTPIGNPGLDAIEAAANPAKVDYLFYVVKPGTCPATHAFTASEEEFNSLVEEYNRAREAEGASPTC